MVEPSLYNLKNQGKNKEFCGENPCFWKKDGFLKTRGSENPDFLKKDGVFKNPGFLKKTGF